MNGFRITQTHYNYRCILNFIYKIFIKGVVIQEDGEYKSVIKLHILGILGSSAFNT